MPTLYVNAGSGSDSSGTGSSGSPYATINKAIDEAAANDTILVQDGTYVEVVQIDKEGLRVQNDTGHSPVIDG